MEGVYRFFKICFKNPHSTFKEWTPLVQNFITGVQFHMQENPEVLF